MSGGVIDVFPFEARTLFDCHNGFSVFPLRGVGEGRAKMLVGSARWGMGGCGRKCLVWQGGLCYYEDVLSSILFILSVPICTTYPSFCCLLLVFAVYCYLFVGLLQLASCNLQMACCLFWGSTHVSMWAWLVFVLLGCLLPAISREHSIFRGNLCLPMLGLC